MSTFQQNTSLRLSSDDRLSTLPPELLTEIFELVRLANGKSQKTVGISRSLLPYMEVSLYRQVRLTSLVVLKLFARTLGMNDDEDKSPQSKIRAQYLGSLVKMFKVFLNHDDELEEGWEDVDGVALFGALLSVKKVSIAYCPHLTKALLSLDCAKSHLNSLTCLVLSGNYRHGNAFVVERFLHLRKYTNLDTLQLWFYKWFPDDPEGLELPLQADSLPSYFALPLRELYVGMRFDDTRNEDLATFLAFFTSLETLSIDDISSNLHMDIVLSKTTSNLLHLSVERADDRDTRDLLFGKVLGRFTSLQSLTLKDAILDESTVLAAQNCKSLQFLRIRPSYNHTWPISALKELLQPRARPPSLRELKLDSGSFCQEGNDLSNIDEFPKNNAERQKQNWWLPSWKDNFSFKQAEEFVKMALKNGVTVTGNLAENIIIQQKWDELKAMHAKRNAAKEATENEGEVGQVA